jgi:hypothetical protein
MTFYCFGVFILPNLNYCSLQQDMHMLVPVGLLCTSGGLVLSHWTDSKYVRAALSPAKLNMIMITISMPVSL